MVRAQNISTFRRYRDPAITVRQTVRSGVRLAPPVRKRKKRSPVRSFFKGVFNIVKMGLFLGAAVCPITCIFVVGWMLID